MDLIIFAHPDNSGSHNAAILRHVSGRLRMKNRPFETIDLYADGFDPVLRLKAEPDGKLALVKRYQSLVAKAERLIFISPVWWYNVPAVLKGFLEHVFNSGFAYSFRLSPENTAILDRHLSGKTAIVINTYGKSKKEAQAHKNPPRLILDKAVLEFCGIRVESRIEWFDVKPPALVPKDVMNLIDRAL